MKIGVDALEMTVIEYMLRLQPQIPTDTSNDGTNICIISVMYNVTDERYELLQVFRNNDAPVQR